MASGVGVGSETVRRTNLSRVLRLLHVDGPATRSELTARVGLNRSTVGTLVGDLVDRGLVHEGAPRATGAPGRPSPLVSVRTDTVAVLAVDVKVDSVAAGLVTLGGEVVARQREERAREHTGVQDTVATIRRLARGVLGSLAADQQLIGVGLAVAGLVHATTGVVQVGPNLGWAEVAIADLVADALGLRVPTRVVNDADAGALAERVRGAGRGVDDLVYLSGEVGVGGGAIVHGRLLAGQRGYAGEFGHMTVDADGLPCQCGAVGCWETRVGESALLRLAGESEDGGRAAVDRVLAAAAEDDEVALGAIAELGWWIGVGMTSIVNVFNPSRVVLGDLHARLHEHVVAQVDEHLARHSLVGGRSEVEVVASALGDDAALVGAAEAVLEQLLTDPLGTVDDATTGEAAHTT